MVESNGLVFFNRPLKLVSNKVRTNNHAVLVGEVKEPAIVGGKLDAIGVGIVLLASYGFERNGDCVRICGEYVVLAVYGVAVLRRVTNRGQERA